MAASTVRDAMHEGAECIGESKTLLDAAKRMAELDAGSLPICGDDDRLKRLCVLDDDKKLNGIITEADIATNASADTTGQFVEAIAAEPPQHF